GIGRECATGQQEMLLTGHEDGSIKFWQASSEQLQVMYKLKTGRHFEKSIAPPVVANSGEEKPTPPHVSHAVADLELCSDSRQLLVASRSGQVTLFRFAKTECCQEIATVMLPQLCRSTVPTTFSPSTPPSPKDGGSAGGDHSPRPRDGSQSRLKQQSRNSGSTGSVTGGGGGRAELRRQPRTVVDASSTSAAPPAAAASSSSRNSSHSTDTSLGSHYAEMTPLKVRGGVLRRPAGYQPELVCQIPWINGSRPERVTALALNSAHGLVALGTKVGLALVDAHTAAQIYAWSNEELLGREPIPFWSTSLNSQVSEMAISPAVEQQPAMASLSTTNTPRKRHPLARALSIRSPCIKQRQFSAQNAPKSPPPVPPAPQLSRHNTTDSATAAGQQSSTTEKFGASLNARLQRPQLVKAFTFNPTQSSSGNGDGSPKEFGASPPQSAGIEPHNCNEFLNLGERGERLNSTIDATEQLRNNAQAIQSRSAKLLEKYEKRKWYQL
uniref:WD_REPEATS_REGION domain-containing protein n=1 Tax=Globodera pallida TaxID=36090 RepID=A0A183CN94_GLOPA